jgi:hypothetical protein
VKPGSLIRCHKCAPLLRRENLSLGESTAP